MLSKVLYFVNSWPLKNHTAGSERIYSFLGTLVNNNRELYMACPEPILQQNASDIQAYPVELISLYQTKPEQAISGLKLEFAMFDTYRVADIYSPVMYSKYNKCIQILDLQDLHGLREWRNRNFIQQYPNLTSDTSKNATATDRRGKKKESSDSKRVALKPEQLGTCLIKRGIPMWEDHAVEYSKQLRAMRRSDLTITCSEYQFYKLSAKHPELNLGLATFLLPLSDFEREIKQKQFRPFQRRKNFVFLGNMKHLPNLDAVHLLIHKIWPLVSQRLNSSKSGSSSKHELHIYGTDIPGYLLANKQQLSQKGIIIMGKMEDVSQIERYVAMLAPLRFGAGVKGKIVDSWFSHTPVITTPIGSEGLFLENSQEELVDVKTKYYSEKVTLTPEQAKGQQLIREYYKSNEFGGSAINTNELNFGGLWQNYEFHEFADSCVRLAEDNELWNKLRVIGAESVIKNHGEAAGLKNLLRGISKSQLRVPTYRKSAEYTNAWKETPIYKPKG